MFNKKKFLIGGLIIFLAIGYLAYTSFESSATYYYTVSELTDYGSSIHGENIRVNGQVAAGSIEKDSGNLKLRFIIAEANKRLPVVYYGVTPDTFKAGNEVVVEGFIDSAGVFQANSILTKCPSKYEPKK